VVAFHDGIVYWLADGFHRYHAHRRAGLDQIEVDVKEGTLREAMLYAVGANTDHGLRRTNEDKRKAVLTMLTNEVVAKDDEGKLWSDREIARRCSVSQTFVSRLRQEFVTENVVSERNASADAAFSDATSDNRVYTTKHGTKATMNTANIGKSNRRRATISGSIAKNARKPRFHDDENGPVPMRTISLPLRNPLLAARAMISIYGEDYIRQLVHELEALLKGEQQ